MTRRPERRIRSDYVPHVRPVLDLADSSFVKSMREPKTFNYVNTIIDGQNIEGWLLDPTDQNLIIPRHKNLKMRLIRIRVINNDPATITRHLELWFDTQATAGESSTLSEAQSAGRELIDVLRVPDNGEDSTRTWSIGQGPVSPPKGGIVYRFQEADAGAGYLALVEYTLER